MFRIHIAGLSYPKFPYLKVLGYALKVVHILNARFPGI